MNMYTYITLREKPNMKEKAAEWFHSKWGVPTEAYLECMEGYLANESEYGWYLCMEGESIIAGLGVIENDFHERKDLTPNVCAVFVEEPYRNQKIAGRLLNYACEDMAKNGIDTLYLVTNHTSFYQRYGWKYYCDVKCDGDDYMSFMYIHKKDCEVKFN